MYSNGEALLRNHTAQLRFIARDVGARVGFFNPGLHRTSVFSALQLAKKSRFVGSHSLDGTILREWTVDRVDKGEVITCGITVYEVQAIRFAIVWAIDDVYLMVESRDLERLREIASEFIEQARQVEPPILSDQQIETLWKNTIAYLEESRLRRIEELGGRARRGLLLTGSPGNGKTMACRWLLEECRKRNWDCRVVGADDYLHARHCNTIDDLFSVVDRGIIFFDDMDRALRDREGGRVADDQSVFLAAMDGIKVARGVVLVFTTNCSLTLIDPAFKRPGRIDVAIEFRKPDSVLRQRLFERWNPEIKSHLDLPRAVAWTAGFSFAEIEELKNLLIMRFIDTNSWDWDWAAARLKANRRQLKSRRPQPVGFKAASKPATNGIAIASDA